MNTEKKIKGWNYMSLSLFAFAVLGVEVVYAYFLEPLLYGTDFGTDMNQWTPMQIILHWILTCITWGITAVLLIKASKSKYQFDLFSKYEKMKLWQWFAIVFCILYSIVTSYLDWGGFKIIKEYQNKGPLLFTVQHIYYFVETILFMLIIVFAQKAFEVWFKNTNIPFGGIICGITWGFAHAFTKGSLWIGLNGIIFGFILGVAYLLVNRDIKKTYLVMLIMFIG